MSSSGRRDMMLNNLMIAIMGLMISTAAARADDRVAQAKQQAETAGIDYRLGRFGAALDEYTKAYELYPVPALLFNIGQCHKNLKDYTKAIFFFEGYLRDEPTAANRTLVEDLIREARAALGKPPEGDVAAAPARPPAPPPPPPVVSRHVESPPRQVDRAPDRSPVLPAVMIGGGVAALAGGGAFYYYGQKRGPDEKFVYSDTRLLGGTLLVLGAAAAVTGAVLWLRHPDPAGAPVAVIGRRAGYLGWARMF